MRNHTLIFLLVITFLLVSLANSCHAELCTELLIPETTIGEYILRVESAQGDLHNVRILYSITRQDGANINPTARFSSFTVHDTKRSFGGGIRYFPSEDGKSIQIEETRSSSQTYDSKETHTVTFENLIFDKDSGSDPIIGNWQVSFKIQVEEEYIDLLETVTMIQPSEVENLNYQLSSIQLSSMGIHIKMSLPDNDINRLTNTFKTSLLFKNGSISNLNLLD